MNIKSFERLLQASPSGAPIEEILRRLETHFMRFGLDPKLKSEPSPLIYSFVRGRVDDPGGSAEFTLASTGTVKIKNLGLGVILQAEDLEFPLTFLGKLYRALTSPEVVKIMRTKI